MRFLKIIKHEIIHRWLMFKAANMVDHSGKSIEEARKEALQLANRMCRERYAYNKTHHFKHKGEDS